jgi:phage major head subunit gpT-like protein
MSSVIKPLIFQLRKAPEFVSKMALTDDNVFFQREYLMGIDARYNAGYGLWQQMYADGDALTADELESAISGLNALNAPNGKPGMFRATHLIVPTSLEWTARRLLESAVLQGTGLVSATDNILKGSLQLIVSKHLDRT